jgi:hypothetical protein
MTDILIGIASFAGGVIAHAAVIKFSRRPSRMLKPRPKPSKRTSQKSSNEASSHIAVHLA